MKKDRTKVIEAFTITHFGMIAFLQHFEEGLDKATRLISPESEKGWVIRARMLHSHVINDQVRFAIEKDAESISHSSFKSIENMEESKTKIIQQESQGVFQYQIEPINHKDKPEIGEELIIKSL